MALSMVSAFGPRAFLKREDPSAAQPKSAGAATENVQTGDKMAEEAAAAAQTKRFEPENFYGGPKLDGYYEQQQPAALLGWMPPYPQQKRFDYYLDNFYGGPAMPAAAPMMARRYAAEYNNNGFAPFYGAPAKRFDFGYAPRSRLSGFL